MRVRPFRSAIAVVEAAESAQEDVKAVMASVKAINQEKAALRAALAARQKLAGRPCPKLDCVTVTSDFTRADLDALVDKTKGDLDKLSELSEMQQIRLQMAMDRQSKMAQALSNILKKISDTSSGIVKNMK